MIGTFNNDIYPETEEGQARKKHADILYAYFKVEKLAREYGLRLACNFDNGVFRLYHGPECLDSTESIFDMADIINLHVQDQKDKLGL